MIHKQNILIISQESFFGNMLSKHHYAIELSRLGYHVYFLEKPSQERNLERGKWNIQSTNYSNLFVVKLRLSIPLIFFDNNKFFYTKYIKYKIRQLQNKLHGFYTVINFDSMDYFPLRFFDKPSTTKIFFPVDQLSILNYKNTSKDCHAVITVAKEITYQKFVKSIPMRYFNHGVEENFLNKPYKSLNYSNIQRKSVALSGNLHQTGLNRNLLKVLILEYISIDFHFFGVFEPSEHDTQESISFIDFLRTRGNVKLRGCLNKEELSFALSEIDFGLVCYNIHDFEYRSWNSHKFLEYLALGMPVLSTYLSFYKDIDAEDKFFMTRKSLDDNEDFKKYFAYILNNLKSLQKYDLFMSRRNFAMKFNYKLLTKELLNEIEGLRSK